MKWNPEYSNSSPIGWNLHLWGMYEFLFRKNNMPNYLLTMPSFAKKNSKYFQQYSVFFPIKSMH